MSPELPERRADPRRSTERDLSRLARRSTASRDFWSSLGVLGTVGWSIALPTVGGALLGRTLDAHFATGVRFTLMLLTAGVCVGSLVAWRSVGRQRR